MVQSKVCAAFLNYKRHDLADRMGEQLGDVDLIAFDNGGGLDYCPKGVKITITRPDNIYFAPGWNWAMQILDSMRYTYVWMLNDDVEGVSPAMLQTLVEKMPEKAAAVTPPFNSPHAVFHPRGGDTREVSWFDWTCPLMRMDAWKDVGDADERFLGYGADLDWCKRARIKGWRFYVVEEAGAVKHLGSVTAISQGLQGKQGSVATMNRLLKEKWGVKDWTGMV
ncbi:MAG: hypothetical protein PHI12_14485 [Dehalococcoidales bacterium]|nr:hypothetical protein [Dehalococcoidales bacterium]